MTTRKTPWLLILLLVVFAAAASSAGVYFYVKSQTHASVEPEKNAAVEAKPQAPLLVPIAPMTVNLQNERQEQSLLYVGFALEVGDQATLSFLREYMPQVRSRILTLLSGQDSTQLISPTGKAALSNMILEAFKQPLATLQPPLDVRSVLYTDFIVQ